MMYASYKMIVLFSLFMMIFATLFCQSAEMTPEDGLQAEIRYTAQRILDNLLEKDYIVVDYINWEVFVFNGRDYSEDYWDAWDYAEEESFFVDLIELMNQKLHYPNDAEDSFTNWKLVKNSYITDVTCNNRKRHVKMSMRVDGIGPYMISLEVKEK